MRPRPVLVIGETPSLGRSVSDLLEVSGIPVELAYDIESKGPMAEIAARYSVIVAASSGYYCSTVRRWAREPTPRTALVVVGSRDPLASEDASLRLVPLPLAPGPRVGLIRTQLSPSGGARGAGSAPRISHRHGGVPTTMELT